MREFRIKVNNEKTYVVKANDYNQAVKTLHSKLRDFDDTKKNINVVREFITNNGGKFSKSKDADAILDFIYKKTGVKNADYGDVLYIVRNYTNVKVEDNAVSDSISRYTGEDAIRTNGFVKIKEDGDWTSYKYNGSDFDNAVFKIHQYNPSLIAFVSNGNRTITVRNKYLNDNASRISDTLSNSEADAVARVSKIHNKFKNGIITDAEFDAKYAEHQRKIDEEVRRAKNLYKIFNGRYDYDTLFKQVFNYTSRGSRLTQLTKTVGDYTYVIYLNNNRILYCVWDKSGNIPKGWSPTVTMYDEYTIKDADMKTAEDIIKKYGGNPVGSVMGLQTTRFVGQDEIKNQHDFAIDLDKAGYKFYLINGRYRISPKDSSINDVSYASGKKLKIGQKIVEDGEVLEVVDIKETQRGVNNNYRDVTLKNVKTGATETVHFGNSTLARLNDYSPKYNKGQKIQTSAGIHEIIGYDPVRADVHTNRIEYSYRLKTPNGTYTNIPDWQLEELVKLGRYKLIDSNISDKLIESGSKKALSKNIATEIKTGKDPKQAAAIAYSVQRENDASTGYKYRITNNGSKWYYETTFPDGHTTLTGPYSSKQETERYFHKHRPTEKLTDADPVKVEKIIRKEKSALGITYYIFQTKSSSGATIYYEVTDKSYHGEPTYSGGGIISFSLKSANDSLDSHLLSDKLKAKYGEKEGTKRFLSGENDSAINDKLSTSDANSLVEAYIDKYKYTHSNLPYVNKPKIKIFNSPEEFRDKFLSSYRGYSIYAGGLLNYNGYVVKLFTSAKDGKIESPSADNIFTIFPTTAIKDSANITELTKKAKQLKNKLKKEKAHSYENWGQAEIRQLKDLFDYNNYSQSTKIINEFINWVDERTPGKIGDSNPNNIKNSKYYTIKVGDKQYKVFAESESEAVDKYIKSKKQ